MTRPPSTPGSARSSIGSTPKRFECWWRGGRVKTLHPAIHGGILADRTNPAHVNELERLPIDPFDLVVVNLYPFEETVASGADREAVVEQIDIGGPTLVRAAAKNFESVAVVVYPSSYELVVEELRPAGGLRRQT